MGCDPPAVTEPPPIVDDDVQVEELEDPEVPPGQMPGGSWLPPVVGIITSGFGVRDDGMMHDGVDLRASIGTVVNAPTDMIIRAVGYEQKAGRYIIADTVRDVGNSIGWKLTFAHLSHVDVFEDQRVAKGAPIALTGLSGAVTGPHLHFRIERLDHTLLGGEKRTAVDPLSVMPLEQLVGGWMH